MNLLKNVLIVLSFFLLSQYAVAESQSTTPSLEATSDELIAIMLKHDGDVARIAAKELIKMPDAVKKLSELCRIKNDRTQKRALWCLKKCGISVKPWLVKVLAKPEDWSPQVIEFAKEMYIDLEDSKNFNATEKALKKYQEVKVQLAEQSRAVSKQKSRIDPYARAVIQSRRSAYYQSNKIFLNNFKNKLAEAENNLEQIRQNFKKAKEECRKFQLL